MGCVLASSAPRGSRREQRALIPALGSKVTPESCSAVPVDVWKVVKHPNVLRAFLARDGSGRPCHVVAWKEAHTMPPVDMAPSVTDSPDVPLVWVCKGGRALIKAEQGGAIPYRYPHVTRPDCGSALDELSALNAIRNLPNVVRLSVDFENLVCVVYVIGVGLVANGHETIPYRAGRLAVHLQP